jgi:outer membrane protein assembly factor BamE (lipoprotein component of BamABCDE complex)
MKKLYIPFSIIVILICGGCIPVPPHYSPIFGTRGYIASETVEFVQDGSTTKEEVLLGLGEPDRVWNDQKRFAYLWKMVVAVGGVGYLVSEIPATYLYLIEFDENDIVKRHEMVKGSLSSDSVIEAKINTW